MNKTNVIKIMNRLLEYLVEASFDLDGVEYIFIESNPKTTMGISMLYPSLEEGHKYMDEYTEEGAIDIAILWADMETLYNMSIWYKGKHFYEPTFIDVAKLNINSFIQFKIKQPMIKIRRRICKNRRQRTHN